MNAAAATVTWIDSTSWELPFFGLPNRIPWPSDIDPAEANKDPFEMEHLIRAVEMLGSDAEAVWQSFGSAIMHLDELTEAMEDSEIVRARELLEEIERLHPGTSFVVFHHAYVARHEGRNDDAITLYQQAASKTPQIAPIWLNLGITLSIAGRRDEAIQAFVKVLELSPNDPTALSGLTQLRALVKLMRDPNDPATATYVDIPTFHRMTAAQIPVLAQQPDQLLAFGEKLMHDGVVPDVGLQALEKAFELRPDHGPTLLTLAAACRVSNQFDKAQELVTRYTQLVPQDADGFFRLAQLANQKGDAEAERAALEKVLELNPNQQQAIGIHFQIQPGEHDPAKEEALIAFGEERQSWMAYLVASNITRLRGDKERGVKLAERALEIAPDEEEVLLNYTVTLGEARDMAKLAGVVKTRIESGKFSKRLDWNYAQVLNGLGLRQDAINVMRKAQADPQATDDFKSSAQVVMEAWTGILTGCGVPLEVHESGFLVRPIVLTLEDGDGGIIVAAGSQLPAEGTFTWRANGPETVVVLQQGQVGSTREPQPLGAFKVSGVTKAASGPTTVECHVAALPDGALHFRARQNGKRLPVQWGAPKANRV